MNSINKPTGVGTHEDEKLLEELRHVSGRKRVTMTRVIESGGYAPDPHGLGAQRSESVSDTPAYETALQLGAGAFAGSGPSALYPKPEQRLITMPLGAKQFSIRTGLTLMTSLTGGGKSVTARALALAALDAGYPALVIPMSEPDQEGPFDDVSSLAAFLEPAVDNQFPRGSIRGAIHDLLPEAARLRDVYATAKAVQQGAPTQVQPDEAPTLLVFDSIALVMRAFGSIETSSTRSRRATQGTMPGGMQPADIEFVSVFHRFAVDNNFVALGPINPDIAPFAPQLEAVCEGRAEVASLESFTLRGRFAGRTFTQYQIPQPFVNATTIALDYGPYTRVSISGGASIGIIQ